MIQSILDHPWTFLTFVLILVVLNLGAAMRVRRDRKLKRRRAIIDRRQMPRQGPERRWTSRPRKK